MPEYLAPGVYIEETSFRQKTIEGVSTSTAGLVGPTRFGPITGAPELLTSYFEFERIYGGIDSLRFGEDTIANDLAHAVRGFFENGGRRLYVSRAFTPPAVEDPPDDPDDGRAGALAPGIASRVIGGEAGSAAGRLRVRARHPGRAGNVLVTFAIRVGPDILVAGSGATPTRLSGAAAFDTVLVVDTATPAEGDEPEPPALYWLEDHLDDDQRTTFRLRPAGAPPDDDDEMPLVTELTDRGVHVVTVSVTVAPMGRSLDERTYEDLAPDPRHRRASLLEEFAAVPARRATQLYVPIVLDGNGNDAALSDGVAVMDRILAEASGAAATASYIQSRLLSVPPAAVEARVQLADGSDGGRPDLATFEGREADDGSKSGLLAFEDLEDISILAAPGSTRRRPGGSGPAEVASIQQALLSHCERMRYRIAVLDPPDGALVSDIRAYRARMDSTHAALYYPWISIMDPLTGREIITPPSGFIAGVYARNDVERGVHKSPANEVVRLAIGFEQSINKGQQDVLNPEGINCLRAFEGRGLRVWGARTITSDPEWRYVAVRRYFAYLQRSIDKGTQWAVFEPNGHVLWNKVRRTVEDFLFNEWSSGHLMGETTDEAFFVTCDRSTMTQNDFDNGRLICLVGVAPLRPAEFVIFRIGQKTLDSRG